MDGEGYFGVNHMNDLGLPPVPDGVEIRGPNPRQTELELNQLLIEYKTLIDLGKIEEAKLLEQVIEITLIELGD